MPEVTIRPDEDDEVTIPRTVDGGQGWNWRYAREIGEMWKLKINVDRAAARDADLELKADAVELDGVATGRLVDLEPDGPAWTLVVRSFEWDAKREPPTEGGDLREGTDKDLMQDLIAEVDGWTEGTVEEHTGDLSFVFNHAHRHEAIRRIEQNVPGEFWVDSDAEAHYVENLGSDKSDTVTLSPESRNVEGDITITDRGREFDATHVRVIGAHEGEAQRFATLVPDDDPESYENRVDYETDRWEPGDPRDWARWENKDVADQDTVEAEAAALGTELAESYVEAEATVVGENLELGDWVHVTKPEAGLDRDMRVVRIETTQEGATVRDHVDLATRTTTRDRESRRLEDIQRFNVAFQGSSVADTTGPIWGAVDDEKPLEFPFRYPDLEFENTAEVVVWGLPYRVDSDPEPHSHSVTIPDHTHEVTIDDHTHDVTFESPFHVHNSNTIVSQETTGETDGHTHTYNQASQTGGPTSREEEATTTESGGGTAETTSSGGGTTETTDDVAGFEPGIFETDDTPSNVDLLINGSTVATDIGSGEFRATVDVSGEMTPGEVHDFEFQSDSLGKLLVTVFLEGYDQIGAK